MMQFYPGDRVTTPRGIGTIEATQQDEAVVCGDDWQFYGTFHLSVLGPVSEPD